MSLRSTPSLQNFATILNYTRLGISYLEAWCQEFLKFLSRVGLNHNIGSVSRRVDLGANYLNPELFSAPEYLAKSGTGFFWLMIRACLRCVDMSNVK
jgi:hypothetical protein